MLGKGHQIRMSPTLELVWNIPLASFFYLLKNTWVKFKFPSAQLAHHLGHTKHHWGNNKSKCLSHHRDPTRQSSGN